MIGSVSSKGKRVAKKVRKAASALAAMPVVDDAKAKAVEVALRALLKTWTLEKTQAMYRTWPEPTEPTLPPAPRVDGFDPNTWDPRTRRFLQNPYPTYAWFRQHRPVHYSPLFKGYFVFGHADVQTVCRDTSKFAATPIGAPAGLPQGLFSADPPEHTALRGILEPAWKQASANAHRLAERSVKAALAPLHGQSCFDLVDDFARPVPRELYFDILGGDGINADDRMEIDAWARCIMKHHDHTLDMLQRRPALIDGLKLAAKLSALMAQSLLDKRFNGSFIQHMAVNLQPLGTVAPATAVRTLLSLTVAGYLSVEFMLANTVRKLLLHQRRDWLALQADEERWTNALAEMQRTDHALAVVDRYSIIDVKFDRGDIPIGARVFGVLASANRDEAVFGNDSELVNIGREPKDNLAFGYGNHECMGKALEAIVTPLALKALMAKFPDLRLTSDAQPPWFEHFYFRSFDHLMLQT